jgi:hypothetical protein
MRKTKPARTVSMGNARGSNAERGLDCYATPPEAVEALLKAEILPKHILEPCCGSGSIVAVLRAHGHKVTASDITTGIDFLAMRKAPKSAGGIVTNPPYKLAAQFIRHGLELVPQVVMLLRLNFLESSARSDLIEGGSLSRVHVFTNRLPRMHREGWEGPRTSATTAYAWFVWDKRYSGPAILNRIQSRG